VKSKNDSIPRVCAFCEHATYTPTTDEVAVIPPLLFQLKAEVLDEDSVCLACPHHKDITPDFSCRRFSFDPLKYRPKKAPQIAKLDEDALLID